MILKKAIDKQTIDEEIVVKKEDYKEEQEYDEDETIRDNNEDMEERFEEYSNIFEEDRHQTKIEMYLGTSTIMISRKKLKLENSQD